MLPESVSVEVIVEIADPVAKLDLREGGAVRTQWVELPADAPPGNALVDAIASVDLVPGAKVWVAGEASAMHRIRRHCFEERGLPRSDVTVRGYWKAGR